MMQCHGDQCVRTTLLLHNYVSTISCKEYKKIGLWVVSDDKGCTWLGVSPNGIVDGEIVVEIKCPYMGGNPYPYRKVPITYIPQCQLEMYVTNTTKCHFVCWTLKRTCVPYWKRWTVYSKSSSTSQNILDWCSWRQTTNTNVWKCPDVKENCKRDHWQFQTIKVSPVA